MKSTNVNDMEAGASDGFHKLNGGEIGKDASSPDISPKSPFEQQYHSTVQVLFTHLST